MKDSEKTEFSQVVRAMFDNYGRQAPLPETLRLWWEMLADCSIERFRVACQVHIASELRFPPTIAQLLALIHPARRSVGPEEAWAIAVKACDESETVLMNDEIAYAWGAAKTLFDLGDEVAARMAFKEVYERRVKEAQDAPKWWPSIGTDPHKRDAALSEAKRTGLLPAPDVVALLPPASREGSSSPEGLKKLKEAMKDLQLGNEAAIAKREQERAEERKRVLNQKQAISNQVANYQKQKRA